jgi:hypothetical protein
MKTNYVRLLRQCDRIEGNSNTGKPTTMAGLEGGGDRQTNQGTRRGKKDQHARDYIRLLR